MRKGVELMLFSKIVLEFRKSSRCESRPVLDVCDLFLETEDDFRALLMKCWKNGSFEAIRKSGTSQNLLRLSMDYIICRTIETSGNAASATEISKDFTS